MTSSASSSGASAATQASPLHVVILAAGQGTRMKSALPKVLHAIGGKPMLAHVVDTARRLGAQGCHVVLGHGSAQVREWADAVSLTGLNWVLQSEQKGTGHAVQQAAPGLPDDAQVLILYGDVPLIPYPTLQALLADAGQGLAVLTTELADPAGYGRIVRDGEGRVVGIVEDKDASAQQRAIREINTGVMAGPARLLKGWLPRLGNANAKGEYYLTDLVAMAAHDGVTVTTVAARAADVEGVNDRAQLARAERIFQVRQAEQLAQQGLGIRDLERFELRGSLRFGTDVSVDVGVVLEGVVELGAGVVIGPYCVLRNVRLAAGTRVEAHSVLEGVEAGQNCRIGPFARIRPDTRLADGAHIGNFVEVKQSEFGAGSKANHLAYVGDARIGARVNIGAGTITCNYDGANKHTTVIGDDVFVGSDSQLVAPVRIGNGATIGAGSTITRDVAAGGLTLCRAREQKTHPDWQRPRKNKP